MFRKNNSDPSASDWQTSLIKHTYGLWEGPPVQKHLDHQSFRLAASQWVSFHVLPHFRLSPFFCQAKERDRALFLSSFCMSRRTQLANLPRIMSSVFPVRALALDTRPSAQSASVDRVEVQLATLVRDPNSLITLQCRNFESAFLSEWLAPHLPSSQRATSDFNSLRTPQHTLVREVLLHLSPKVAIHCNPTTRMNNPLSEGGHFEWYSLCWIWNETVHLHPPLQNSTASGSLRIVL